MNAKIARKISKALPSSRARSLPKRWKNFVLAFLTFGDKVVLDLGCHVGVYSLLMSGVSKHVVGIDKNPKSIKMAQQASLELGITNVEFHCINVLDLTEEFMMSRDIRDVFLHKVGGSFRKEDSVKIGKLFMNCGVTNIVSNGCLAAAEAAVKMFYDDSYKCRMLTNNLVSTYKEKQ